MTVPDTDQMDFDTLHALLAWQVELGATDPICDTPQNRYDAPAPAPARAAPMPQASEAGLPPVFQPEDPVALAGAAADAANDLAALRAALSAFEHCELKKGARNTVFSDGIPGARVMVIGEAPGRDEDIEGRPFVGKAGQLLDRMFDAIGMGRADQAAPVYITNVIPWRPPQNRDPEPAEIAMMMPFVRRHVLLARPDILILMGNISCQALLGRKGITRLRGQFTEVLGLPVLPMFHPAYLLRNPAAKREAWQDLLALQAWLRGSGAGDGRG